MLNLKDKCNVREVAIYGKIILKLILDKKVMFYDTFGKGTLCDFVNMVMDFLIL